jgi:hypothetical protein
MRVFPTAAAFVSLLIALAQPGTGGAAAPRLNAPPLPLPAPLNSLFGSGSSASETTPAAASSSPSGARPQSVTTARYAPALQRSIVAEINQHFYPAGRARVWGAGENLAWSTPDLSAEHGIELWLASPSHRRILLDKRWRQVGIGVVQADNAGGVYRGEDVVTVAGEFGLRR